MSGDVIGLPLAGEMMPLLTVDGLLRFILYIIDGTCVQVVMVK